MTADMGFALVVVLLVALGIVKLWTDWLVVKNRRALEDDILERLDRLERHVQFLENQRRKL